MNDIFNGDDRSEDSPRVSGAGGTRLQDRRQVSMRRKQIRMRVETIASSTQASGDQSKLVSEISSPGLTSQHGSMEHTSRSSKVQVSLPHPTTLNRRIIKDLEAVAYGSQPTYESAIRRLLDAVDGSLKPLQLYLHHRPPSEQLLFVEYCPMRRRFRLSRDDEVVLFDENTNLRGSVLFTAANKFVKVAGDLSQVQLQEFKNSLANSVLVGQETLERLEFCYLISNYGETASLSGFQMFAETFSLVLQQGLLEPAATCSNRIELAERLLELEHKTTGNRHCRRHNYLVLGGQNCEGGEFVLASKEQLLFETMQFSLITNEEDFRPEERCYFPACYYTELYSCLFTFPQCSLDINQRAKVFQYCKEENYSLEQVLVSPYLSYITMLSAEEFENYQGGTYLVYLVLGPVGAEKSALLEVMQKKAETFGCEAIYLQKPPASRLGSFNKEELEHHFNKSDRHFAFSKHCLILVDYPFYEQLPEQIAEAMSKLCPPDIHYKLFHVLLESTNHLRFKDEIVERDVEFPFSAELIIHCLLNIQERKDSIGLNGNGVESLARALYYICSAFKNYRLETHEYCRQRLIRVPFNVEFESIRSNLVRYLEQLLSISFKREYDRNENLMHYFLSEIEELVVVRQPDFSEIADEVFSQTFRRLPYYPL